MRWLLISESLFLGKPVLSVPVEGQFEQWINSYFLEQLGFGRSVQNARLCKDAVRRFASDRDQFARIIRQQNFDSTDAVLKALLTFL